MAARPTTPLFLAWLYQALVAQDSPCLLLSAEGVQQYLCLAESVLLFVGQPADWAERERSISQRPDAPLQEEWRTARRFRAWIDFSLVDWMSGLDRVSSTLGLSQRRVAFLYFRGLQKKEVGLARDHPPPKIFTECRVARLVLLLSLTDAVLFFHSPLKSLTNNNHSFPFLFLFHFLHTQHSTRIHSSLSLIGIKSRLHREVVRCDSNSSSTASWLPPHTT
jgi:hypothetical protein